MKIILKNSTTNAETILCDGATRDLNKSAGPRDFSSPLGFIVDQQQFFRGTTTKPRPRGNGATEIRFTIARRCSTQDAALLWLLDHMATTQTSDTLILKWDLSSGPRTLTIPYVALQRIEPVAPTSATVTVTYTLQGGRPATS